VYAVAVAREMGADRIIVVEGIQERIDLAQAFGADHIIDMRDQTEPADRIKTVRNLTEQWGAEVVADFAGRPSATAEGIEMLARTGTYLEIGNIVPGRTFEFDPSWFALGNRRLLGVCYYEPRHLFESLQVLLRTKDKYPWDRVVSNVLPLAEIDHAFELADKGAGNRVAIAP
jgi:threonine dehydrogenase-like Zn-dependent dehydrogenase